MISCTQTLFTDVPLCLLMRSIKNCGKFSYIVHAFIYVCGCGCGCVGVGVDVWVWVVGVCGCELLSLLERYYYLNVHKVSFHAFGVRISRMEAATVQKSHSVRKPDMSIHKQI